MQGRTTFIIAHRIQSLMHADMILVLDRGRIVQRGNHDELMSQEGMYRRIHDMQARIEDELEEEMAGFEIQDPMRGLQDPAQIPIGKTARD
jgi:ATP-binding cassette, subfamily B, bacterial